MAGAGYKLFNTGDVLTAAQVNTYLQEQTVMVFASSAARTSALSGVLAEGMVSYLQDTNAVEVYNGSAWVGVSGAGDVTEVQAGTGISVASGTGPIPVVTNTMATAFDAKGDLIGGTGADTFAKLTVGANDTVLTADSSAATGLKWATPSGSSGPAFRATRSSSAQSITSGAYVKLQFDTETFDTDSCYDPSTNYRFTPNKAGYYFVYAGAYFGASSASSVLLRLYKNGSVYLPAIWSNGGSTNQNITTTGSSFIYLNGSTDYIEMYGYHGGSSPIFGTENESAQFAAFWVRS